MTNPPLIGPGGALFMGVYLFALILIALCQLCDTGSFPHPVHSSHQKYQRTLFNIETLTLAIKC